MLTSRQATRVRAPAVLGDCMIMLFIADMSKTFKQVNIHKAAGPDIFPGCILRACADQLASVFTDIFNLSLTQPVIPTVPVKSMDTPTHSKVCLHCRIIVKTSKL